MSAWTVSSRNAIFVLLLCLGTSAFAQKRPAPPCRVAEFRTLALATHDPAARAARAVEWLNRHGTGCTKEQLQSIADNRATWMGTADNPQVMGLVDGLLESRAQGKGTAMDRLYSSPAGAPGAAAETVTTPPARPPLEDARPGYGVLSGVMPGVMPPGNRPPSELRNDVADRPSASADQPQARPER